MERNAIDGGEFCVGNMAWSLSGLSSLGGGGGGRHSRQVVHLPPSPSRFVVFSPCVSLLSCTLTITSGWCFLWQHTTGMEHCLSLIQWQIMSHRKLLLIGWQIICHIQDLMIQWQIMSHSTLLLIQRQIICHVQQCN